MAKTRKRRARRSSDLGDNSFQATYHRNRAGKKSRRTHAAPLVALLVVGFIAGLGLWLTSVGTVAVVGMEDQGLGERIERQADEMFNFQWQVADESLSGLAVDFNTHISSIKADRNILKRSLILEVSPRRPSLNWRSDGDSYLVDSEGVVLEEGTDSGLPSVVDSAGLSVATGERAAPQHFIEFAIAISDSQLEIERLLITETSSELYAELTSGYAIRFATTEDAATQLRNVGRVQEIASDRNDNIGEYIDVRIPHKAYYR